MNDLVRLKSKEHLESIFQKYAQIKELDFEDDMIILWHYELTFKNIKETCECIGYDNFLLPLRFINEIENNVYGISAPQFEEFYIDILGIRNLKISKDKDYIGLLGGCIPDEINFTKDGFLQCIFLS